MVQVLPSSYFRANFLTVGPNAANDMALESLRKCETFCYILFLPIPYCFKSILKMAKKYFRHNFYKLYRNGANNIPMKSYGKCKTFSCWWFSLIPGRFQVISKTAGSFVLPLPRNRFFENAPREEPELVGACSWTSLCFSRDFFASRSSSTTRSSPSTHRNWASDIPVESCCKHATFLCWSFFHTHDGFKSFSSEIHSV